MKAWKNIETQFGVINLALQQKRLQIWPYKNKKDLL